MPYSDDYNTGNPFQWLKAGFACYGIHVGLSIVVAVVVVVTGLTEDILPIMVTYMGIGWIPLAIWGYPFLKRKLK